MKIKIKMYCVSLIAISAIVSCNNSSKTGSPVIGKGNQEDSTQVHVAALYQCPMDCEKGKTYDKPGKCPVCEMDLEKK